MASSFFTVLDDIAILADDVAVASKTSVQSTIGILGDDVAVGAKQATGFKESRELQIIYKIAKGSLLNKIIILPLAFLISFLYPPAIIIILLFGGLFLAFEGFEGVLHWFNTEKKEKKSEVILSDEELLEIENKKIKGAIKTDFILSIEIIILAMNSVLKESFIIQFSATTFVALLATFGVYGLVALIVRLDDLGFFLKDKGLNTIGNICISSLPIIIKTLSVVGVIAMLMVAGGIFTHNIHLFHLDFGSLSFIYEIFLASLIGAGIVGGHQLYDKINKKVNK